jgi:hypothetical protein
MKIINIKGSGIRPHDDIPGFFYCGRNVWGWPKSPLHNPFRVDKPGKKRDGTREEAIAKFCVYLQARIEDKTLVERTVGINRMIATLRDVRKEAWEAWEQSKENTEHQVKELISESLDAKGNPTADTRQRMKVIHRTEGRLPKAKFLDIILHTLKQEAELLGLYLPKEQHHEGNGSPAVLSVNVQEYQPPDIEQFRPLPISERIQWLREWKPSPEKTNGEGVPPEQVGA